MLHLRGGIRVASFFRSSAATKSTNAKFYSNFWPLSYPANANRQESKQTFPSFHGLEKKQHFCSKSTNNDITTETANVAEAGITKTAVDEPQQEQESINGKTLVKKSLLDADGEPIATVKLKQGRTGFKYFKLSTGHKYFSSIPVPEDAYTFVRAMDVLLGQVATKEGQKLPNSSERRQLFSTSSPGLFYDYKLDLEWNAGHFNVILGTRRTKATKKSEYKEKTFSLSVKEFHWIRHEMGAMLAEFDGSEPVDVPPKLPDHLLMLDGPPRSQAVPKVPKAPMARSQAASKAPTLARPRPSVPRIPKQKQRQASPSAANMAPANTGSREVEAVIEAILRRRAERKGGRSDQLGQQQG